MKILPVIFLLSSVIIFIVIKLICKILTQKKNKALHNIKNTEIKNNETTSSDSSKKEDVSLSPSSTSKWTLDEITKREG